MTVYYAPYHSREVNQTDGYFLLSRSQSAGRHHAPVGERAGVTPDMAVRLPGAQRRP